eukprot:CAMPEP_0184696164 /NCGR_PEP_ID=MMETSP0313-20130426/3548_1 /TAXON_ID=2792 /ORGANISM="Porphyridium aerugineum, Strain SAG 1380-2" /LENGTH=319 /DNA_ID=CAMNT_0027154737 /DNA_START=108 /DNA_END=1067 /DNA_ORIENTATION=+
MVLSQEEKAALASVLDTVTCGQVVQGQNPITIPATATLDEACEIIASNGILSALVENPDGPGYVGSFSYRSLLMFFLNQVPAHGDKPAAVVDLRSVIMQAKPDVKAADFCREKGKGYETVTVDQPLRAAVDLFAKGIHRCSVMDANNAIVVGTLSQSLALRFLAARMDSAFPNVITKRIGDLNMGNRPAVCIEERKNVIEGMDIMYKHKLSSIAVIDETGRLTGNLSLSDIKYVFQSRAYQMLWYTVKSFIKVLRERQPLESNMAMDTFPFFDITKERTLQLAIQKMIATRVHHLWIVNESGKPTGVCSMTDIMKVFAS